MMETRYFLSLVKHANSGMSISQSSALYLNELLRYIKVMKRDKNYAGFIIMV